MFRSGSVKLPDAICIKQTHLLTNSTITMTLASYRVTHICVSKLTIIGSDNGSSPGRHWNIVNSKLGNRLHWNLKRNSKIFIQENAFENTVCEITVGELRSTLCTKTPLYIYVRSGSHIKQMPLFYLANAAGPFILHEGNVVEHYGSCTE